MRNIVLIIAASISFTAPPAFAAAPICGDVNVSGDVTTSDALAVLRKSVGQPLFLQCDQCPAGATYGNTTDFVTTEALYSGYLQGTAYEIPVPSTVTHLGLIAGSSGQHGRIALYTDNGGEPDQLVVGTSVFTLVEGAQVIAVPPTLVAAGAYWIMTTSDDTILLGINKDVGGTPLKYRSLAFGAQLPEGFGAVLDVSYSPQNLYVQVAPVVQ